MGICMDYLKVIKENQDKFLENPRKGIEDLLKFQEEHIKNFVKLAIFDKKVDLLILYYQFRKEYSKLIGAMLKAGVIHGGVFKDDVESVITIQRNNENSKVMAEVFNKPEMEEGIALRLSKSYTSSLELFWKRIKNLIFHAGLNPQEKHLNIRDVKKLVTKLEKEYKVNLSLIKSVLDSKLRNSVNHENNYFEPPNIVVFLDKKGGKTKEIARLTTEKIYELIGKIMIINSATFSIEFAAMLAVLEPLLKLNDEELNQYSKTGKLTPEMIDKINRL